MKFFLAIFTFSLALTLTGSAAELSPANPKIPVLRVFEPVSLKAVGSAPAGLTFNKQRPLLSVTNVRDLKLARNGKGVVLRLNDKDTRAFSELSRKYQRRTLLLVATDQVMQLLDVTAPVTDGALFFDQPVDAAIATYLRQRFRLGEFK